MPAGSVTTHIKLHSAITFGLADEIRRRMLFVSSAITDFELVVGGGAVTGVTVYSTEPLDLAVMTRKVNAVIDNDVRPQVVTPAKVIWRSPVRREVAEGTFEALAEAGAVTETGEGQVAIGEPLLMLFQYFDGASSAC